MGASKEEGSIAIVRVGALKTVHESVRGFHIGACAERFGSSDTATQQVAGVPGLLCVLPNPLPLLCSALLCSARLCSALISQDFHPCVCHCLLPVCTEQKSAVDSRWQALLDELSDLNVKLTALRQKPKAPEAAAAGESTTAGAEAAAALKKLESRKHAVNVELDSTREEV